MDEGYIKLWRKSLNSGLLKNPHLWTFWCWCLMKATWKPMKQMVGNQMVELLPGQFVFGRKAAAEELEVGEKIIRTRLEILKNLKNVAIKPTNKFSIITICNWETYQNNEKENGQQKGQQRANNGPTTGHKQEGKEGKEIEEGKEKDLLVPLLEKPERVLKFSEDDMKMAVLFSDMMTDNNPSRKPSTAGQLGSWANEVRLMRERDKRTTDDIEAHIRFSQNDHFWKTNAESMGKIRNKYDQFTLLMERKPEHRYDNTRSTRIHTSDDQPWPDDTNR